MSILKIYQSTWPIKQMAVKNYECIYLIYNPLTQLSKIGITANVNQRVAQLSSSGGCELELINTAEFWAEIDEPAGYVEQFLHSIFKEYRVRGEWFNFNEQQINRVSSFINLIPN